jgi:hypothetical protein
MGNMRAFAGEIDQQGENDIVKDKLFRPPSRLFDSLEKNNCKEYETFDSKGVHSPAAE